MAWGSQWQDSWGGNQQGQRQRVGEQRAVGVLVDWQHKAGKSFGWIVPIHGVPTHLPEASAHGGDVYVHWRDIQDPRPGAVVTFWPYTDAQGLGAEECVSRSVLRFALPRDSKCGLTLPMDEVNPCTSYLTSSIFYPELEERGVTLRKYLWDSPLTVFELWGTPEAVVQVADDIGLLVHPEAEVLTSRSMARHEPPEFLREISSEELPNVPPRFRVALSLSKSGGDPRQRLLGLLRA